MKNLLLLLLTLTCLKSAGAYGQEYNASQFGCLSDGKHTNTSSIQYAIDFIAEKGGGKLHFYVGRYLTGGIQLKSNVTIVLHEGAALVASPNFYDYLKDEQGYSLIVGDKLSQVKIEGQGVIQGQDSLLQRNLLSLLEKGYIKGNIQDFQPTLLSLTNCKDVQVDGIFWNNALKAAQQYTRVQNLSLTNLNIKGEQQANAKGIIIKESKGLTLSNIYIDTSGKPFEKDSTSELIKVEKAILPSGKSIL
ncbi:hypothetical protein J5U18_02240 [Sphingobacteriaceae bacterium WQ 2009]|uniref:Uncharacterized protein n=1 Tax=Rhinopithecimicrobium faecis TaxID=2820698 RepID=A0A8T4HC92_9SPHI|nr:hypothetical protein [Sphingobacteriaceae bacterium WQ 2009]